MTMRSNLHSRLKGRSRPDPMRSYDALPPVLRGWLAAAALHWSPQSALTLWRRAMHDSGGRTDEALERLDRSEARLLRRDTAAVWGRDHPGAGR